MNPCACLMQRDKCSARQCGVEMSNKDIGHTCQLVLGRQNMCRARKQQRHIPHGSSLSFKALSGPRQALESAKAGLVPGHSRRQAPLYVGGRHSGPQRMAQLGNGFLAPAARHICKNTYTSCDVLQLWVRVFSDTSKSTAVKRGQVCKPGACEDRMPLQEHTCEELDCGEKGRLKGPVACRSAPTALQHDSSARVLPLLRYRPVSRVNERRDDTLRQLPRQRLNTGKRSGGLLEGTLPES